MIEDIQNTELRSRCKQKIESLELWLRRLIDQVLSTKYGNYFEFRNENGDRLISNRIISPLQDRVKSDPKRYPRNIDAVLLDDAISIICNPTLYSEFKPALSEAFPEGYAEARTFLRRLLPPRNKLAHANPITLHEAERIYCYCRDVTNSISNYYTAENVNQEYNVPLIIRFTDSFGNSVHRDQMQVTPLGGIMRSYSGEAEFDLRPGDTLTIEVEMDPSYDEAEYCLSWKVLKGSSQVLSNNNRLVLEIDVSHVGQQLSILCEVKTNKAWHKLNNGSDDQLFITYRVLPPA